MSTYWLCYYAIVLQDVTTAKKKKKKSVKVMWDLSALFLANACESVFQSKKFDEKNPQMILLCS